MFLYLEALFVICFSVAIIFVKKLPFKITAVIIIIGGISLITAAHTRNESNRLQEGNIYEVLAVAENCGDNNICFIVKDRIDDDKIFLYKQEISVTGRKIEKGDIVILQYNSLSKL